MADVNLPKEHADVRSSVWRRGASHPCDLMPWPFFKLGQFKLGQVFPSSRTGNAALLDLALGQGDWK